MKNKAISQETRSRAILKRLTSSTILFIILFIVAYGAILSFVSPNFLTPYNMGIILRQLSFFGVAALGQTLVLIIGGIDLSVGSTACLGGIFFATFLTKMNMNPILAIALTLIFGCVMGFVNGLIITGLNLTPFIVTLATSEMCYGLVLVITEGYTISGITGWVLQLGQGVLFGFLPVPFLIFLIMALLLAYLLRCTPFGRHLYAIGGNEAASRLVGVPVKRKKRNIYMLSGLLCAAAGVLIACRYNAGQPTIGEDWTMTTITAAVIGGTSMSGGVGGVLGTVIGAYLIQLLSNSIVILNVSQYWEQVVTGGVVLIAVAIDAVRTIARNKG